MLGLIPERRREDFVFGDGPRRNGDPARGFSGWSKAKAALDARSGSTEWRLHDLRRTAATRMADLGVQPHVIEAVLNHVSGHEAGVAGVYNRSTYSAEKRRALDLWADHVAAVVEGRQSNIVPLRAEGADPSRKVMGP
jgi:integrase